MKTWFENLAAREQAVVAAGAVLAIVIIVWGLVWRPLSRNTAELRVSVADRTQLLSDLRRAEGVGGPAPGRSAAGDEESILLIVDSSAHRFGIAESFTQTRPNGRDEISVSFQRAPFDALIAWLIELEASYGITAGSVSMTDAGQPGLVNGQIFLNRS